MIKFYKTIHPPTKDPIFFIANGCVQRMEQLMMTSKNIIVYCVLCMADGMLVYLCYCIIILLYEGLVYIL